MKFLYPFVIASAFCTQNAQSFANVAIYDTKRLTSTRSGVGECQTTMPRRHTRQSLHMVWPQQVTDLIPTVSTTLVSSIETNSGTPLSLLLPISGSVCIMLSIVGFLQLWEWFVETAREELPRFVRPAFEKILGEIGGLGFIGLVLSAILGNPLLHDNLNHLSEQIFEEEDVLVETFEFLHEVFFQTGVLFFCTAGFVLVRTLSTLDEFTRLAETTIVSSKREAKGQNNVVSDKVLDILKAEQISGASNSENRVVKSRPIAMSDYETLLRIESSTISPAWKREMMLTKEERGAEVLIIRERLIQENPNLPDNFRIIDFLESAFSDSKVDVVGITPTSWIPLIPSIALANAVDLAHGVVNSQAETAVSSSGFFFSTPWVVWPVSLLQILGVIWGATNFWKMSKIKSMLVPRVVRDDDEHGSSQILPPPVEIDALRKSFSSSPAFLRPIENFFYKPVDNRVQELFGNVGGGGPDFYLQSLKFHSWYTVTGICVFASQILPRDLYALLGTSTNTPVGDPDHLIPEIALYGAFALVQLFLLAMAPTTFTNYCLVTCVEAIVRNDDIACSIIDEMKDEQ